ncbi:MAG: PhnD/SsuA/transferrin family substrate-binding protein [Verrucomicrobiales bacterium]|nr:PhnD/SsuA/transferrin family substrate-binding protein [Verrucomicrobiales bacterium]
MNPGGRDAGWTGGRRNRALAFVVLSLCACALSRTGPRARAEEGTGEANPFRFAVTANILVNVNPNDARAAVRVWTQLVAKDRGIRVDPEPYILDDVDAVIRRMGEGQLDAVMLTLPEYRRLSRHQELCDFHVPVQGGRTHVQYLVLARRDGGVEALNQLKGKRLGSYENPRNCMAVTWLDLVLSKEGQPPVASFFGARSHQKKLSAAVLPLFFRQLDTCVVDRLGFETLVELNPQVGKQLGAVLTSPEFVPMVFCMRVGYPATIRKQLVETLKTLHESEAGRQVLTVLQFERFRPVEPDALRGSLALLEEHDRLASEAGERLEAASQASASAAVIGGEARHP